MFLYEMHKIWALWRNSLGCHSSWKLPCPLSPPLVIQKEHWLLTVDLPHFLMESAHFLLLCFASDWGPTGRLAWGLDPCASVTCSTLPPLLLLWSWQTIEQHPYRGLPGRLLTKFYANILNTGCTCLHTQYTTESGSSGNLGEH